MEPFYFEVLRLHFGNPILRAVILSHLFFLPVDLLLGKDDIITTDRLRMFEFP